MVSISISDDDEKTFYLEHHIDSLNEIVLSAKAYTTKTETVLENTIDRDMLENYSGQSLGDAIRNLSGVTTLNTGNTVVKPVINGLHSSRVSTINNGVRMQDQEWGVEHSPNVDLNTASRITVIKGASALQYTGDAIGGIIVTEPVRIPIKDSLFGRSIFTFSSNGKGGSNTTSLIKSFESGWNAQIQGTFKRFGDFESPDYVLSNTGNFERDFLLKSGLNRINWGVDILYSYFKNEVGILRASHLGGAEDQVIAINSDRPLIIEDFTYEIDQPRQEVTHQIGKVNVFKKYEGFGTVKFQYDFQLNNRLEFDVRRGDNRDTPSVDLELTTHNFQMDLEEDEGNFSFKTGLAFNYQTNFANPDTGVRRLIPDYDQYKLGGFFIADYQFSDRLIGEAGIRFDHTSMDVLKFYRTSFWESRNYDELFPELVVEEFGNQILTNPKPSFNNVAATLGASYNLKDDWWIFSNLALSQRAPNPSELFSEGLHHSASRIELGDLRFSSEISKKVLLAIQKKGNLSFSVQPFYNHLDNFIIIEPTGVQQTVRGNFQVWEYRQVPAAIFGVDVDFGYKISETLDFSHQFSFLKGYERSNSTPLINMPPVNLYNTLAYTKESWSFSVKQQYVFRQNEFPNNNFEVFLPETETFETVDVSTPPDAYNLFEIAGNYTFVLFEKTKAAIGIQVQNLFNQSYRNYLNRLRYYADDLGRNFLITTKINF